MKRIITLLFLMLLSGFLFAKGNKEAPLLQETDLISYISPNGDSIQDLASFEISADLILKSDIGYIPIMVLQIINNEDQVIKENKYEETQDISRSKAAFRKWKKFTLKRKLQWDGLTNEGSIAPDGEYRARIIMIDASDNENSTNLGKIRVDTHFPEIKINFNNEKIFSPNDDNKKELFIIRQQGSSEKKWTAEILDHEDFVIKAINWENKPPEDIKWNGRDRNGNLLPSGYYQYRIQSTDAAGNKTIEVIKDIELNLMSTSLTASLSSTSLFSATEKDTIDVKIMPETQEGLLEWSYSLRKKDSLNYMIISESSSPIPATMTVTALDLTGAPIEEGFYDFVLSAKYRNGNSPAYSQQIYIDGSPTEGSLILPQWPVISPNGDGVFDSIVIEQTGTTESEWIIEILDAEGNPVLSQIRQNSEPGEFIWDGKNNTGSVVENGIYQYVLTAKNAAGDVCFSKTAGGIRVSNYSTEITATYPTNALSPNGDGENDEIEIALEYEQVDHVIGWEWSLMKKDSEIQLVNQKGEELPSTIQINGLDNKQKPLDEGVYKLNYAVQYDNGNQPVVSEEFYIDVTPPEIKVSTISDPFSKTPEGGIKGNYYITLDVTDNDEIKGWELDIRDKKGEIVRSFTGEGNPTAKIAWNGESETGEQAKAEDKYQLDLKVLDRAGNKSAFDKNINLDIFIVEKNGKYYLMVPNIIFAAYQAELNSAGKKQSEQNLASILKVKEIFDKYPEYRLILEGHALNIYPKGSPEWDTEEAILIPLTEERAKIVLETIIKSGMAKNQISTEAKGGSNPIVSTQNKKIRWKNRRVEFVMQPKSDRKPSKQK